MPLVALFVWQICLEVEEKFRPLCIVVFFVWSYNYGIQKEWEKQQQFELFSKLLPLQLGSFHLITKWLNLLIEGWQFEKWHDNTNSRWKLRIHTIQVLFKTFSSWAYNFILCYVFNVVKSKKISLLR